MLHKVNFGIYCKTLLPMAWWGRHTPLIEKAVSFISSCVFAEI